MQTVRFLLDVVTSTSIGIDCPIRIRCPNCSPITAWRVPLGRDKGAQKILFLLILPLMNAPRSNSVSMVAKKPASAGTCLVLSSQWCHLAPFIWTNGQGFTKANVALGWIHSNFTLQREQVQVWLIAQKLWRKIRCLTTHIYCNKTSIQVQDDTYWAGTAWHHWPNMAKWPWSYLVNDITRVIPNPLFTLNVYWKMSFTVSQWLNWTRPSFSGIFLFRPKTFIVSDIDLHWWITWLTMDIPHGAYFCLFVFNKKDILIN